MPVVDYDMLNFLLYLCIRVKIEITLIYLWSLYHEGWSSLPLYCKLSGGRNTCKQGSYNALAVKRIPFCRHPSIFCVTSGCTNISILTNSDSPTRVYNSNMHTQILSTQVVPAGCHARKKQEVPDSSEHGHLRQEVWPALKTETRWNEDKEGNK